MSIRKKITGNDPQIEGILKGIAIWAIIITVIAFSVRWFFGDW